MTGSAPTSGLSVDGIAIPREVEAEGGAAIAAYIDAHRSTDAPTDAPADSAEAPTPKPPRKRGN